MSQIPSWSPEQQAAFDYRQDGEYLQLFSILYYVLAGLSTLCGCVPIFHLSIGIGMFSGAIRPPNPGGAEELTAIGAVMMVAASIAILCGWVMACLLFWTGRKLSRAESYNFCFVMACLICISIPIGTILGVLTIVTLNRPSMKARFAANRNGLPPVGWQPPPEKQPPYSQYS